MYQFLPFVTKQPRYAAQYLWIHISSIELQVIWKLRILIEMEDFELVHTFLEQYDKEPLIKNTTPNNWNPKEHPSDLMNYHILQIHISTENCKDQFQLY